MNYAVQINKAGMPMVVACATYEAGRRVGDIPIEEACAQPPGRFV